jgi:hypothetical protein
MNVLIIKYPNGRSECRTGEEAAQTLEKINVSRITLEALKSGIPFNHPDGRIMTIENETRVCNGCGAELDEQGFCTAGISKAD